MNAQDIYELVREWPREAWPEGVEYEVGSIGEDPLPMFVISLDGIEVESDEIDPAEHWKGEGPEMVADPACLCPSQLAELLFEASGMRWLEQHGCVRTSKTSDGTNVLYEVSYGSDKKERRRGAKDRASTRIEAISKAVLAVARSKP